jgi:hypothetical protein
LCETAGSGKKKAGNDIAHRGPYKPNRGKRIKIGSAILESLALLEVQTEGVHLHENFLSVITADAEHVEDGLVGGKNQLEFHMFVAIFDVGVGEGIQRKLYFFGSERESVKPLILGRILQNHEFGPAGRHVLGLQQQVA